MPDSQESVPELSKLQTFFNVATDLLCIAGTDGYLQHIDPAFCKVLGYSEQHLLSQPLLSFIHPDDRASSQKEIEQAIRGKNMPAAIQNRWWHQDGSWRWLEWNVTPVGGEGTLLFYGVARDITLRKQAEAKIHKVNSLLEIQVQAAAQRLALYADLLSSLSLPVNVFKLLDPADPRSLTLIMTNPAAADELGVDI